MLQSIKIIITCILLSIVYGICHDLITAHISIEYFTIGHPKIIASNSPVLLALSWGVLATWWVGLLLGVALSIVARSGTLPKIHHVQLIRPMLFLLAIMATVATLSALIGYFLAVNGTIYLNSPFAEKIPEHKHTAFLTAGWAHAASYLTGIIGGAVLCFKIWSERKTNRSFSKV